MHVVEVNDLSFSCRTVYEGQPVYGVSFEVDKGEIFAIAGTGESGKSTVVRHLNALLLPESGSVSVCGTDTADSNNWTAVRKTCGMVFQDSGARFFTSSVGEEISFALNCAGIAPENIHEKAGAYLELVGMAGREKERTAALTEYEKLCVQIAAVLAAETEVLVFDNAASRIYGKDRESYFDLLQKLRGGGKTVILCTSAFDEAAAADRVLLLAGGKALKCGETRSVLSDMELLEKAGIEPAFPMRVYHDLLDSDIKLARPPLNMRELVDELCL